MKKCDVCGNTLHIMGRFKYAEGYICKECYKKASRKFTETIIQKSFEEIKELCEEYNEEIESFEMTGKIGNYLLVDEIHHKICIPNNRMLYKKISNPEFYEIKDLKKCEITFAPQITIQELEDKVNKRQEGIVKSLRVSFCFKDKMPKKEIILIANPVRIKSYAFRQSFHFAKRIEEEVNRLMKSL